MTPDTERQKFHQIFANALALLNNENTEYSCKLIDISLHGCLLHIKDNTELDNHETPYTLTLILSDIAPIVMNLSISHALANEVSFKCEHIDADDILALRHFITLNSADSKLLDRQLIALTHCD